MDAVDGPSLMFFPRRHIVSQGDTVIFKILAEEVNSLMAAEIHIDFDPSKIEIISISQGSFFQNSQESIFNYEINNGSIGVLTSLLNSESLSVNGTGNLIQFVVKILQSDSSYISFIGNNVLRDPNNNDITINEKINGKIEIE